MRLTKMLRRRAAEDRRVREHIWAMRESAIPGWSPALLEQPATDTVAFPRILLAGTVRCVALGLAAATLALGLGAQPVSAHGWTSVASVSQSTAAIMVVMRDGATLRVVPGASTLRYRSEPRMVLIDSHACVKVSVDGRPWRRLKATTRQYRPVEDVATRLKVWRCR